MDVEKEEPSAVATAVAVAPPTVSVNKAAAPSIPMHSQQKQGAKFCGCW
jgi:hypothetical protein